MDPKMWSGLKIALRLGSIRSWFQQCTARSQSTGTDVHHYYTGTRTRALFLGVSVHEHSTGPGDTQDTVAHSALCNGAAFSTSRDQSARCSATGPRHRQEHRSCLHPQDEQLQLILSLFYQATEPAHVRLLALGAPRQRCHVPTHRSVWSLDTVGARLCRICSPTARLPQSISCTMHTTEPVPRTGVRSVRGEKSESSHRSEE